MSRLFALCLTVLLSGIPAAWAEDLTAPERRLISLFEAAKSAVVSITTGQRQIDPWRRRAQIVPSGSGSGFFWDDSGHIVTNAHVVWPYTEVRVVFSDGYAIEKAPVTARDLMVDLAIIGPVETSIRRCQWSMVRSMSSAAMYI